MSLVETVLDSLSECISDGNISWTTEVDMNAVSFAVGENDYFPDHACRMMSIIRYASSQVREELSQVGIGAIDGNRIIISRTERAKCVATARCVPQFKIAQRVHFSE